MVIDDLLNKITEQDYDYTFFNQIPNIRDRAIILERALDLALNLLDVSNNEVAICIKPNDFHCNFKNKAQCKFKDECSSKIDC